MNDNREIFEVPGVYEKRIIFCGQLAGIILDPWTLDKLLFTNFIFLASTINFWICCISRLFVFFFSKYIFVSFQAVIQLALVTFVIDDLFSKVTRQFGTRWKRQFGTKTFRHRWKKVSNRHRIFFQI
jgi:hypothetical protein